MLHCYSEILIKVRLSRTMGQWTLSCFSILTSRYSSSSLLRLLLFFLNRYNTSNLKKRQSKTEPKKAYTPHTLSILTPSLCSCPRPPPPYCLCLHPWNCYRLQKRSIILLSFVHLSSPLYCWFPPPPRCKWSTRRSSSSTKKKTPVEYQKCQLNYIKSLKELWSKSCASATFFPYNHCSARHL